MTDGGDIEVRIEGTVEIGWTALVADVRDGDYTTFTYPPGYDPNEDHAERVATDVMHWLNEREAHGT